MSCGRRHGGFTMIEILVTLFILAIGLLGLAGMQALAQKTELESYQRAQALILLNDIIDRIRTNRPAATCYAITNPASGTPYLGTTSGSHYNVGGFSCPSVSTNPAAVARVRRDLAEIDNALQGAAEAAGGTPVGAMIGARACIGFDANSQSYSVAVAWQGISKTFSPANWDASKTPATARNCAVNQYGDLADPLGDTQRRVVWNTLLIATLK